MLKQASTPSGITLLTSPQLTALGVPHAFTTRLGGVSPAPYDALNLANPAPDGDSAANISRNFELVAEALGCGGHRVVRVTQVHGRNVVAVGARANVDASTCADSLVTSKRGQLLAIRVADCVPALIAATDGRGTVLAVAAVHAGWKGVAVNIAQAAVERLTADYRADPAHMFAAVGPCIRLEHFEVGPEVAEAFIAANLAAVISRTQGPKPHIDLTEAVRLQLHRAGIPAARIDTGDHCTYRDAALLYSHRRDKGVTGRQAGLIAMPA